MTIHLSNTAPSSKASTASKASTTIPAQKVLIITYYWPPSGGAGVQRWLKFTKYLPEYGWEPVVLTVDPDYAAYPAFDKTLEKELPSGLKIYKTKARNWYKIYAKDKSRIPSAGFANNRENSIRGRLSRFIRGNIFIPDPRRGWNRYAYKKAAELIENKEIQHIITTSPPHSTQLIGLKIKKIFPEIKWIADFRDPWTDIYYYGKFYGTLPAKWYDRKLEKEVLNNADKIITVGNGLAKLLSGKISKKTADITVITNGYDEEDFKEPTTDRKDNNFIFTYVGTISDNYPIETFIKVISELKKVRRKEVLFRVVGQISKKQEALINQQLEEKNRTFIPYSDHRTAIKYMLNSDILLSVIPDDPKNELIITGKLFEYLRTGNPILCLGPPGGDAAKILALRQIPVFRYVDEKGISAYITNLPEKTGLKSDIEKWERSNITRNLADCLKK